MDLTFLKTLVLLYVEDEESLRRSVADSLAPFVGKIIEANDGAEGLQLFGEHRDELDLIVSDITMPVMDGIEMVQHIRERNSTIPVIYTTAYSDADFMLKTISLSAAGYIVKPLNIETLLNGIQQATLRIENMRLRESLKNINKELEAKVERKTEELRGKNLELQQQLYTDTLTSLPNRTALAHDLASAPHPMLMIFNVDAFRSVNELYGETEGNHVLIHIARLLKSYADKVHCQSYRIGGDTFAMLKEASTDLTICKKHAIGFLKKLSNEAIPIRSYQTQIRLTASVGASDEKEEQIEKASLALKKAKEAGVHFQMYDPSFGFGQMYHNDITIINVIQKAIPNNGVVVYNQPIVDPTGRTIKYEALIRIEDGETVYSPFAFLDIAKKAKLYTKLTHIVLDKVFDLARRYQCSLNVNLTIHDIENEATISEIKERMVAHDIAHLITFEIVESESIHDYKKVITFMESLRALGSRIAIDDFGSGYSNFSYMLRLKPDFIKIDGSLIRNIDTDNNAYHITRAINDFSHSLGIQTVAEFVHSEAVFNTLLEIGIDQFQGYYFGEPKKITDHDLVC